MRYGKHAIAALVLGLCVSRTHAQAENRLLVVAQVCFLESGWNETDCAAEVGVARTRAKRVNGSWLTVLRQYSALDKGSERSKRVRTYPWGDVPGMTPKWQERWRELRASVVRIDAGEVPNPCPGAEDWGGTMDHPHPRMIPVACTSQTANTFYRLGPKSTRTITAAKASGIR